MAFPNDCESFFTCADGKKSKDLTWASFWKFLIGSDDNGCPAVKVTGTITASVEAPLMSATGDDLIEADDNVTLLSDIAAWKAAAPQAGKKLLSTTNISSINKQAVILTYTT